MDKLDRMIEQALAEEDRAILEETKELGFFTQFTRQMSGPNAWVNWLVTVGIFAYVAVAFWAGWKFYIATEALYAIKWGLLASVSIMAIAMLKLYLFQKMESDRVIRQLKRVELMLAARDR